MGRRAESRQVGSHRAVRRRPRRLLVPAFVLLACFATLALVVGLSTISLRSAEHGRLQERERLVVQSALAGEISADPAKVAEAVGGTGFVQGNNALNSLALHSLQMTPDGGTNDVVALLDRTGHPLAVEPSAALPTISDLGPAWAAAWRGTAVDSPVFRWNGQPAAATIAPVGSRHPWAVVVAVQRLQSGIAQRYVERLGGLGSTGGGLIAVRDGIAIAAWDPKLLGQRLLSEQEFNRLPDRQVHTWRSTVDGKQVVTIAWRDRRTGYAELFRQPSAQLFGDLRQQYIHRTRSMLIVLGVAFLALASFLWRARRVEVRARRRLHALLEGATDLVVVVDRRDRLNFVSPSITRLLGGTERAWRGRTLAALADPVDLPRLERVCREGGTALNIRLQDTEGTSHWFDVHAADLTDEPAIAGVLLTCHAVSARKHLEDQLAAAANTDMLTGLANRSGFALRLQAMSSSTTLLHPTPLALLYIDLDGFKPVNDAHGHAVGDAVLRVIAARLATVVRDRDQACRFGGDEFGVILVDVSEEAADAVADRVQALLREPIDVGGLQVTIDSSLGIAFHSGGAVDPELLVREADQAMYQAKRAGGRSRVLRRVPAAAAAEPLPQVAVPASPGVSTPPAATAAVSRTRRRRVRWRSVVAYVLPVVLAAGVMAGVGGVVWRVDAQTQHQAEQQRLHERLDLVANQAEYALGIADPSDSATTVNGLPWSVSSSPINQLMLRSIAGTPVMGKAGLAFLVSPRGTVVDAYPASAHLAPAPEGWLWDAALDGQAGHGDTVWTAGAFRAYFTLPVVRDGRTVAVVVLAPDLRTTVGQQLSAASSALGFGDGGISYVDRKGVAQTSWNAALLGTKLVEGDQLTALPAGEAAVVSAPAGQIALAAPLKKHLGGMLLRQSTSAFYSDLRQGEGALDGGLLAVVAATMLGLLVLNARRVHALRRSRAQLDAILTHAHDLQIVLDGQGRASFVGPSVERLLGYSPARCHGHQLNEIVHPQDAEWFAEFRRIVAATGTGQVSDVRLRTASGEYRPFDMTGSRIRAPRSIRGVLLTCHDVSQRHELQESLVHAAGHDLLTGLPNRSTFAASMRRASVTTEKCAVLFLDLDNFKPVNDRFGHDAGDEVLRQAAGRLTGLCRSGDEVCRLGGDEFAVLLSGADRAAAELIADRVIEAFAQPFQIAGEMVSLGTSVGIAVSDADTELDALLRDADAAMYQAKSAGRNHYRVFASAVSEQPAPPA